MYEFDFKTLYSTIWGQRKRIFINCVLAFVIALIVGFSIPKTYSASASLAPEMNSNDMMSASGLNSIASMVGVNFQNSPDAITPMLYSNVISSNKFIIDLLYTQIETLDGEVKTDLKTYMKEYVRKPWWSYVFSWIPKLIGRLLPTDESVVLSEDGTISPFIMSKDDANLIEKVRNMIKCSVDEETMVVSLRVSAQDPLVAASMVDTVKTHLQQFVIDYQTNKARMDYMYYKKLEKQTRAAYDKVLAEYGEYCDTHKMTVTQGSKNEEERLANEVQLAYTAYSQVVQNMLVADAKVQEETPAFTEIEGPSVSHKADSPKKLLIVIALVFITFVGTLGRIYLKLLFPKR